MYEWKTPNNYKGTSKEVQSGMIASNDCVGTPLSQLAAVVQRLFEVEPPVQVVVAIHQNFPSANNTQSSAGNVMLPAALILTATLFKAVVEIVFKAPDEVPTEILSPI